MLRVASVLEGLSVELDLMQCLCMRIGSRSCGVGVLMRRAVADRYRKCHESRSR